MRWSRQILPLLLLLCAPLLWAQGEGSTVKPTSKITLQGGNATSLFIHANTLFVTTDLGQIELFDLANNKPKGIITLPKIRTFYEDSLPPKVFGVDSLDGKRLLILSQDSDGGHRLSLYAKGTLATLFETKDRLSIKKALFLNENLILLGLISHEILLYDLSKKSFTYRKQLSTSHLSDMILTQDRREFLTSCESGDIYIGDPFTGELRRTLAGIHKDNVYQIATRQNRVISGGQDRRVGIFVLDGDSQQPRSIKGDFLIYSVGISPLGKVAAYIKNESNDIALFDVEDLQERATLKGHRSLIHTLWFLSEKELISAADEKIILRWRLP